MNTKLVERSVKRISRSCLIEWPKRILWSYTIKPFFRFICLSGEKRKVVISAWFLLVGIRLGLLLLPFQNLTRLLEAVYGRGSNQSKGGDNRVDRVLWAVETASRYVPRTTCLSRALAAQALLGQIGYPTSLRIGVKRGEQNALHTHAWLEAEGNVLIGRLPDLCCYKPLISVRANSQATEAELMQNHVSERSFFSLGTQR